jgi:hypothetical protein
MNLKMMLNRNVLTQASHKDMVVQWRISCVSLYDKYAQNKENHCSRKLDEEN